MFLREWAVERTTTDKLEAALNDVSERSRFVYQVDYVGGRDWVVVSYRDITQGE